MTTQLHPLQQGDAVAAGVCPQCNGSGMVEFCEIKPGELNDATEVSRAHWVRALEGGYFEVDGYRSARRCQCATKSAAKKKAHKQAEHLRSTQTWASWEARRTSIFIHDKANVQREVIYTRLATWDNSRSLYLFGNMGIGKTHILNAMAHKAIGDGVAALYVNLHDLLSRQRATFGGHTMAKSPVDNAAEAPVLLIDDLGVDKLTSWVAETVYDLCDRRLRAELPTVYASNLSPSRLQRYLTMSFDTEKAEATHIAQNGQRVFSRIVASCDVFEFRRRK
ncbi:MAG: ATP-binding protein [Nannocystaceae bacterium]